MQTSVGETMAKEIALKAEYFANSDDATLEVVLNLLRQQFLLMQFDDYCIEVHDHDYPAVVSTLQSLKHEIELNKPH